MADLLAKQSKPLTLSRGQEVEGEVVAILSQEVILDLGTKSEGVLSKKDLSQQQLANLKVGDKLVTSVIQTENESGQVILGLQRTISKQTSASGRWEKFVMALKENKVLKGKGIEVNKGGLIVEVEGIRGFLPSSQVSLSQASNLDELVGKEVSVTVIEVDPNQNRLIFSQKTNLSEDIKAHLSKLKIGDKVEGEVAAVLPFGIFVTLEGPVEGLVHISEISWEKTEDPNTEYKIGDKVQAQVISVDESTGRVNLSIRQLTQDPFLKKIEGINPDDVIKGKVSKITSQAVLIELENGIEGYVHSSKLEQDASYEVGKEESFLVDSVDNQKRRINLVPFITTTKGLIYK